MSADTQSVKSQQPLILSVDDDLRQHRLVETYLAKNGYQVLFASNGREALEQADASRPDLILLDVMMPEMDGYQVCSELQKKKETAYIPVVFVTVLAEEQNKAKAFSVGAVDYLTKPYTKQVILEKVEKHIHDKTQWKEISEIESEEPETSQQTDDFNRFKTFLGEQLDLNTMDRHKVSKALLSNIYSTCDAIGIKSSSVAQLIAEFTNLPYLGIINPNDVKLGLLPARFCKSNMVVAMNDASSDVAFVVTNPFNLHLMDMLKQFVKPNQKYKILISDPENIRWLVFSSGKPDEEEPEVTADDAAQAVMPSWSGAEGIHDPELKDVDYLKESASEAPVINLTYELILKAVQAGASDIHVEPRETGLGVRYRIDGMLNERFPIAKKLQPAVISRLKIIANMDIAERRVPQDGNLRFLHKGQFVDMRVSTLPSRYGEKMVLRIMDNSAVSLDFQSLGFEGRNLGHFNESIRKPYGILLVTGPTGSGKTTTLYSALQAINDPTKNIITVEDPVELELHRITQVQVNPKAGLTFPKALRSILRQDPDIIMIGEMRDRETADIAIKAALTGHLVLSTLHTNDCPSTLARLLDMGLEPYLVAPSVEMIMAQRLMRKLCTKCKEPSENPEPLLQVLNMEMPSGMKFFQASACQHCNNTGYKGRMAVFEVMVIDEDLRRMIHRTATVDEIRRYAMESSGMFSLRESALSKAAAGETSLEEVLRVTLK